VRSKGLFVYCGARDDRLIQARVRMPATDDADVGEVLATVGLERLNFGRVVWRYRPLPFEPQLPAIFERIRAFDRQIDDVARPQPRSSTRSPGFSSSPSASHSLSHSALAPPLALAMTQSG
jgi:hypothetical protein